MSASDDFLRDRGIGERQRVSPTEMARELGIERRQVIRECIELGVDFDNGLLNRPLYLERRASRS